MTVLTWVAVLVAAWCLVSVVTAFGLGALLRRGTDGDTEIVGNRRRRGELSDTALAMWLAEVPRVPDTPAALIVDLPAPRRGTTAGPSEVPTLR